MIPFAKTFASCTAAFLLIGTAGAETRFSVDFPYTTQATAEQNYQGFKRTAYRACRAEYRQTRSLSLRHNLVKACQSQVLDLVVDRVQDPEILALHRPNTQSPDWRVFADNN